MFFVGTPVYRSMRHKPRIRAFDRIRILAQQLAHGVAGQRLGANSTALIRLYSGRVRFASVTKSRTSAVCPRHSRSPRRSSCPFPSPRIPSRRQACQDAFQLFGADVLAAVQNDQVLLAAGQEVVAVLVLAGQIASVEPAVRVNDLGGGLRDLYSSPASHSRPACTARRPPACTRSGRRPCPGADVLCVLRVVDEAVAAGLGAAVALGDEHAVFDQIQQHLRVEHGRLPQGSHRPFSLSCCRASHRGGCTPSAPAPRPWPGWASAPGPYRSCRRSLPRFRAQPMRPRRTGR